MKRKRMMIMVRLEGPILDVNDTLAAINATASQTMIMNSMEYEG